MKRSKRNISFVMTYHSEDGEECVSSVFVCYCDQANACVCSSNERVRESSNRRYPIRLEEGTSKVRVPATGLQKNHVYPSYSELPRVRLPLSVLRVRSTIRALDTATSLVICVCVGQLRRPFEIMPRCRVCAGLGPSGARAAVPAESPREK